MSVRLILDIRHLEAYARNSLVGLVNATVKPYDLLMFVVACCHTVHEPTPVYEILTSYDNYDGEDFQHDAQMVSSLVEHLKDMYYKLLATEGNVVDSQGRAYSTYPYSHCKIQGVSLHVYFHSPEPYVMNPLALRLRHV